MSKLENYPEKLKSKSFPNNVVNIFNSLPYHVKNDIFSPTFSNVVAIHYYSKCRCLVPCKGCQTIQQFDIELDALWSNMPTYGQRAPYAHLQHTNLNYAELINTLFIYGPTYIQHYSQEFKPFQQKLFDKIEDLFDTET